MGGMIPVAAGNDWLSQLAPDHAPPPPGWWPPAPGWWVLIALIIAVVVVSILWWRHLPRRRRRHTLHQIGQLESGIPDDIALARELEHLMRRYAVSHHGRERVARLSGMQWIEFVVRHGGRDWDGAVGSDLLCLAYGGDAPTHRQLWLKGARAFVKSRKQASA